MCYFAILSRYIRRNPTLAKKKLLDIVRCTLNSSEIKYPSGFSIDRLFKPFKVLFASFVNL